MKTLSAIIIIVFLSVCLLGQTPDKMSYQAIIRNNYGQLITNQNIGIQISLLQGSASGATMYVEYHMTTTNINGMVSLEIGAGIAISGDFSSLDWSNGPYFIKVETDINGGNNYTISGTSQLLSVPYSLYSKNGLKPGTNIGELLYWNGQQWSSLSPGTEGNVLTLVNGIPKWEGRGFGDVVNPVTGKIWMDRNLGASQIAISSTDVNAYGDLYQWGRATDGHEKRSSTTSKIPSKTDNPDHGYFITTLDDPYDWHYPQNDSLWQGVNGINNPCPHGYRIPTISEWEEERQSWSSNDADGAFASPLKLTVGGFRINTNGTCTDAGSDGFYWSTTADSSDALYLYVLNNHAGVYHEYRAYGFSVRCIKDQ